MICFSNIVYKCWACIGSQSVSLCCSPSPSAHHPSNSEILAPVYQNVHTTGSTCFPWTSWGVEPKIYSLNHMLCQSNIIIFQKNDVWPYLGTLQKLKPFFNKMFAYVVLWMGLPAMMICNSIWVLNNRLIKRC